MFQWLKFLIRAGIPILDWGWGDCVDSSYILSKPRMKLKEFSDYCNFFFPVT